GCYGAVAICSHDPAVFLTPDISPSFKVKKLYKPTSKRSFGLPAPILDYKSYAPHLKLEKYTFLDRQYVFVPTSIEYDRKKINWVVDWLARHRDCEVNFVFMGWGRDSESAKQALMNSANVIFLNEFVSTPLIYFFMAKSLAIIDSFGEPGYGTAVIEASALGVPVVGRVDLSEYGDQAVYQDMQSPPIFNCETVEDVNIALNHICYDFYDRQVHSEAHFDWYTDSHSTSAITKDWIPVLVNKTAANC
ncbi:glycosyltransferase, partial [Litorivicinus sp.]|nr:glycosyltransferase [Litorivicinus sp.]